MGFFFSFFLIAQESIIECHRGHGVVDRRCLNFIDRMIKMNKTINENKYKYYCTSDPATWEFADSCEQETPNTELHGAKGDDQRYIEVRGRLGGGRRGKGGGVQRVPDKWWEGRRAITRAVGNKDKDNGNTQIEGHKHSNVMDTNNSMGDKEAGMICPASSRNYKQGNRKDPGPLQTTLNEFWKGKERDMRSWSEEMAELEEIEAEQRKARQESFLSYV